MTTFPTDFIWGTATSSYQIEGGTFEGGRGPSIWDSFAAIPGTIRNGDQAIIACDHYHRIEEDVAILKALNVKAYRFSIAWPRIQPTGHGEGHPEGLAFYNRLIDALINAGITPWVTLYHWDLPLSLEMREGGWLEPNIVDTFATYAKICFKAFGDRVKNWFTLNEPWCSAILGYAVGAHAPGRKGSPSLAYTAGHHLLLAHAQAVRIYREEFSTHQQGRISISFNCDWRLPATDHPDDLAAAQRSLEFFLGWFADPIYRGDYPDIMRQKAGNRLPKFSKEEQKLILGSSDFFGLNHYSTCLASPDQKGQGQSVQGNGGYFADANVALSTKPEWKLTDMGWPIVPSGCRDLLLWISKRYGNPELFITENGMAHRAELLNDQARIEFYQGYLEAIHQAMDLGVLVKGYFAWTLMDNFEWSHGYDRRFGLVHVDFETQKRTPKASYYYMAELFKTSVLKASQP